MAKQIMNEQHLTKKERYLLKRQRKEGEHLSKIRKKKIKKILSIYLPLILIVGGLVFVLVSYFPKENQTTNISNTEKQRITIFYSPTCACCKEYIPYLRKNGFEVETKPMRDMLSVKEQYQIPGNMESCHTLVIGDYFVEGHVPVEAINKLLEEKPEIDGIALPGMPAGSPGMGGFKIGKWTIYSLINGQFSEFLSW